MIGFASEEEWHMQYLIAVLDRAELQQHLSATEVDRLTDQDMADIAQAMKEELEETNFWQQCAFIARCKLAEKEQHKPTNGT
jgi:hypothetical protein